MICVLCAVLGSLSQVGDNMCAVRCAGFGDTACSPGDVFVGSGVRVWL